MRVGNSERTFKVVIGDWSGDGHDKAKEYYVLVPSRFTKDDLFANFQKTENDLGFSPYDFANEYEDSKIPPEYNKILASNGFDLDALQTRLWGNSSEFVFPDGEVSIGEEEMLEIIMFFFGRGLEGFTWRKFEAEEVLIGPDGVRSGFVGYGLFF